MGAAKPSVEPRTCADCPAELRKRNQSGRCRSCLTRFHLHKPETQQKAADGLRRHFESPAARKAAGERSRGQLVQWRADPENRARMRAIAKKNLLQVPKGDNAARIRAIRAHHYPGIPEHRWDECAKLAKSIPPAEAKRMIREDEALKERARLAAMTPFERQMEKVRNGARLIEKPDLRPAAHTFTLGGVATGML
jgi:hypothetical protein